MSRRQQNINRILGALREGTVAVRRDPSDQNYRRWEAKIQRAGRDKSAGWIVMLGAGVLFIGVIVVYRISSTPPKDRVTKSYSGCYLHNDNPNYNVVNVRADCDVKPCGYDDSTIVGEYPNNTLVKVSSASGRKSGRFTWIPVVLIHNGQAVWVASTKVRC